MVADRAIVRYSTLGPHEARWEVSFVERDNGSARIIVVPLDRTKPKSWSLKRMVEEPIRFGPTTSRRRFVVLRARRGEAPRVIAHSDTFRTALLHAERLHRPRRIDTAVWDTDRNSIEAEWAA